MHPASGMERPSGSCAALREKKERRKGGIHGYQPSCRSGDERTSTNGSSLVPRSGLRKGESMITHLPGMSLPTASTLDINIRVTQPLNVTSFCARQRVTQHVMHELSTQLGGDTPELTVGERVYWSVPVVFT